MYDSRVKLVIKAIDKRVNKILRHGKTDIKTYYDKAVHYYILKFLYKEACNY